MKKKLSFISFGLILLALGQTGCMKDGEESDRKGTDGNLVKVTITAGSDALTRTSYQGDGINHAIHWCNNDKIGVVAYSSELRDTWFGNNVCFDIVEYDKAYGRFEGTLNKLHLGEEESHNIIYHAYYPYRAAPDNTIKDRTTLRTRIPDKQYPAADTYDCDADLLIGETVNANAKLGYMDTDNGVVPLNFMFKRLVAITKLSFPNVPVKIANEKIETITFTATGGEVIAGDINVDLTIGIRSTGVQPSASINLDYSGKDVTLSDESFSAWFTMLPVTLRDFTIVITTENFIITKTVEADRDVKFEVNSVNRASIVLEDEATVTITPKVYYKRVAGVSEIVSGEKYLMVGYVSDSHIRAMDKTIPNQGSIIDARYTDISAYYDAGKDTFVSNNEIDGYAYTITNTGSSTYRLQTSSGIYLGHYSGSTGFSTADNQDWTIAPSAPYPITIVNKNYSVAILYRYISSHDRFVTYPTSYYGTPGHYLPRLYIKTELQ